MNGFCPENYLNLLKHYLYGEYINEYLTFYEASFNYTKQAVVSGRPFFYLFWVYSSAFAFMRATRFSVLIFESDSESRHQCAAFLFDVFHFCIAVQAVDPKGFQSLRYSYKYPVV